MRPVLGRLLCQTVGLTLALGFVACTDTDNPLNPSVRALYTTPTGLVTANPPQIFVGAGDISSCSNTGDEATAKLLDAIPDPATVYNIGDDAYDNGSTSEFANCYNPTWGRHKYRTKPTPGNHEYNSSGAAPYYAYFGAAAGPSGRGYYSFDLGAWHIISLNSNVSSSAGSAQDTWLRADLAAHPNQCLLAYYHHPLYSSTATYSSVRGLVNALYAYHADLILNGHRHYYEREKLMDPSGNADPVNGVREIIAGTGGIGGGSTNPSYPLTEVSNGSTFGVLKLYLYDDSYAWKFIPVAGKTFTDSGSTACHSSGVGGGGVSASNSTVSANPTSFTAGSGSSTITVTARDGSNNLISGAGVTLSSTGSGNTFTPSSGTTNGSGVFTSTFTSTVAEGKTISATINGTGITQTPSITVLPSGGGGGGTITQTVLTTASNGSNQTVYTTASIAPAANALVMVAVLGRRSSGALTPTVSGGGISTWTQVASVDYDPVGTPASRLVLFRGMSALPGSGPITLTFSSGMSNAIWTVSQWTGVDQTGTNGSGAIGQTGTANGDNVTSLSKALSAFANPNNVGFGVVGVSANPPFVTPGAGSSELAETGTGESTDLEIQSGVNDNTIAATFNAGVNGGLLGVEIKAGSSGQTVSPGNSIVTATTPITAGGSSTIDVTVKDGSGNPMSGVTVTLSATGSNTITQPAAPTDGTGHTSGSLSATVAGSNTVTAVAGGVTLSTKPVVVVNPGAANKLAFTGQPSNTQAGAPIAPAVVAEIQDQFGNRVTSTNNVTMAIGTNPNSGTLSGTLQQAAVNGDATFSDLSIDKTGNGYTIGASTTGGVTGATSSAFNITAPAPSPTQSTVVAGSPTFTAGGSSSITVTVKDGLGNPLGGVPVTLSSAVVGDVVTNPASATDGSGVATGSVSATSAGPRTITAVAGGVTLSQKPALTVSAGPADAGKSTVAAAPSSIAANSGISTVTVTVKDAFGNPVSNSTVIVSATGSGNTVTGPSGTTGANGLATATFSSSVAEAKTVSATADGLGVTQTATVTVTPPNTAATITHTLLTSGANPVNLNTYTTASIAPGANKLIIVAVLNHRTPSAISPTLSGGGMTAWTLVASVDFDTIGGALRRLTVFRAMSPTPTSGPITVKFTNSVSNVEWIVSQWDGVDISGTNGSGAIVQSGTTATNGSNGLAVALAPFSNPNDVAYGAFGVNKNVLAIAPGAGYTKIDEQPSGENTPGDLLTEWAVNLTTVNATWTSLRGGAIGVEIKAAIGP